MRFMVLMRLWGCVQIGDDHSLRSKKVVSLGVKPVMLSAFRMNGSPYVFAALDRPAVVHEHNGKLVFSPLNESNLTHLCTFSTEAFPGAIAMCKDDKLMITAIDAIQRLHVRCDTTCAACSLPATVHADHCHPLLYHCTVKFASCQ